MARWRLQVRMAYNNNAGISFKWSHLWFVEAETIDQVAVTAESMKGPYRNMLLTQAFVYEYYITDLAPATTQFRTVAYAAPQRGLVTIPAGAALLPYFAVARVDLNVHNSRPSRKFHRTPLLHVHTSGGELISAHSALLAAEFGTLRSLSGVVDESGNPFTGVQVKGVTSRRLGRQAQVGVPALPST